MRGLHATRTLWRLAWRNIGKIIPSEPWRRPEPAPLTAVADGHIRLHLFSADFDSPAAARAFCFAPPGPDQPVALNRELEGAFVDTAEVEVVTAPIDQRLSEFLSEDDVRDILLRMGGDNTLILVTEQAFGGLPYDLDDTATLTYLGDQVVPV